MTFFIPIRSTTEFYLNLQIPVSKNCLQKLFTQAFGKGKWKKWFWMEGVRRNVMEGCENVGQARAGMRGSKPSSGGWMEKGGRGKVGCGGVSEAAGWVKKSSK